MCGDSRWKNQRKIYRCICVGSIQTIRQGKYTLIDGLYICNDQISEKAGNHWFLIYSNQNDIYFVDSFAKPVEFYNLETFLRPSQVLQTRLQSYLSDVCGEYTLFFSYHLSRGKRLVDILKFFTSEYIQNDMLVKNFIHMKFLGHKR